MYLMGYENILCKQLTVNIGDIELASEEPSLKARWQVGGELGCLEGEVCIVWGIDVLDFFIKIYGPPLLACMLIGKVSCI